MSCYGNGCTSYALARTAGDGTMSRLQTPTAAPLAYVTGGRYQGLFSMPTVEQAYISQYQPKPEDSIGLQLLMVHDKPDNYKICIFDPGRCRLAIFQVIPIGYFYRVVKIVKVEDFFHWFLKFWCNIMEKGISHLIPK